MTSTLHVREFDYAPVLDVAGRFRDESASAGNLVDQLLAELEADRADLERREAELAAREAEFEQRQAEFAAERKASDSLRQQLETQQELWQQALAELQKCSVRSQPDSERELQFAAARELWESQTGELAEERDALRSQVEKSHDEILQLGHILKQVLETQAELAAALPAGDNPPEPDTAFVAELEQERGLLEAELEMVRRRAAELTEMVSEQKRELAEQRSTAAQELRHVRQLLERAPRVEQRPEPVTVAAAPVPVATPAAVPAPAPQPAAAAHDPVVDSVMAQFAKLQKDVSQRRQRRK